jgi:hypothetical protein
MDVIEAHARRLPPVDERFTPRPYPREELLRALEAGRVAGVATHPLDNVRGNARLLLEGDPDKQFGLTGLQDGLVLQDVLDLVSVGAGVPLDPTREFGEVRIAPEPILDACAALGRRLARGPPGGERVQ